MTLDNLNKAIWLETVYNIGLSYDMSTDSVRPQRDFVPRSAFYHIVAPMIETRKDERGIVVTDLDGREAYWEAFQWVTPWIKSADLEMVEFQFVLDGNYDGPRSTIVDLNNEPILAVRNHLARRKDIDADRLTYWQARRLTLTPWLKPSHTEYVACLSA